MNTDTTLRIDSDSSEATEQVAARMGTKLRGGEVIALASDLGGGKTAFVRGLARGMGSRDHVTSPTFTLGREYHAENVGLTLYHFDFYRLQDQGAGIMMASLEETVRDPKAVTAIEWGEIVEGVLPDQQVRIEIKLIGETTRELVITYPPELSYLFSKIKKVAT